MRRKFDDFMIGFNELVLNSKKPWLIRSYGLLREFSTYALYVPSVLLNRSPNVKNNFVIYAQGRTGSTLLVDLLNSNPHIHCDREIFALRTFFTEPFLKAKRSLYRNPTYGCKILGVQLQRQVSRRGMHHFMITIHRHGWKIIYLTRRNVLRHALSHLLMRQRGTRKRHQFEKDGPFKVDKVHIDINQLQNTIENIQDLNALDEKALGGIPHLRLVYEDDLLRSELHQKTMDRIFEYLGLNSSPVKTDLVRITSDNLSDFVSNFDEMKTFLHKTPYAKSL